ncbi:MAG: aminoacyl-tRNA hydrolase [Pseudomonadota bacterium]
MLILMGQGNPGPKYSGNRHNLGFFVIDEIAAAFDFPAWREKFNAMVSEGWVEADGKRNKVLLMKPLTFYNETGQSVSKALKFFKLQSDAVTVFHDEIDLAPGRVRVKQGGGHSGNNGIRSVSSHIGPDFRRVRIGVGHPGEKSRVMPYVLSDFPKSEEPWVTSFLDACIRSLPLLINGDDERFQTEVLRLAPAPKSDPKKKARGES